MSPEQEHQLIGRLVTDYQDAKRKYAAARIELEAVADTFIEIGRRLKVSPELFVAADHSDSPIFAKAEDMSTQLREQRARIDKLREQLKSLNVAVE